jgi:hypothetical protein
MFRAAIVMKVGILIAPTIVLNQTFNEFKESRTTLLAMELRQRVVEPPPCDKGPGKSE